MRSIIAGKAALACGCALAAIVAAPQAAFAQEETVQPGATPTGATIVDSSAEGKAAADHSIVVTGSRIKQDPNNSALPLQIVTMQEINQNGISSPEQLLSFLPSMGSGADNLASNSDVVDSTRRGNNGASFANLRGQGSGSTLVLLNGRRVSSHGMTGAAVDVNQIPFAALERVEVLKDGASAVYGTDAVGGVINFITRKDFKGIDLSGFTDITQEADSPIYRLSGVVGFGDLQSQGFNVMASVGYTKRGALQANQRSFVNTFQHDKGLGVDTRGTPYATIVSLAGSAISSSSQMPYIAAGSTQKATGGVNILRLPGQAGCDSIPLMGDYDTDVWAAPSNSLACTFDTGRNVYLQQPIETWTYYGRAVKDFGRHELSLEITGSSAVSDKSFSQIQITPSSARNYTYKLVPGVNDETYNSIYNTLVDYYNSVGSTVPFTYGQGFSYRWRCMECGERQIKTTTDTFRAALDMTGPMFGDWTYDVGALYAESRSRSKLGKGYYYQDALVAALNSGYINPFVTEGQTQSAEAMALLNAASAEGVELYNGKYSVKEADASISGSLFELPNGPVKVAIGVNYRREEYKFLGDKRVDQNTIYSAPFDNGNALDGVHRDVKSAYAELLVPLIKGMDLSLAGRIDDYSGFGTTTNPKVSLKYRPIDQVMFRGSYTTAFRVPNFNQIYNATSDSTYTGAAYADPSKCPGGVINLSDPNCQALSTATGNTFDVRYGGNLNLGPETADEFTAGIVLELGNRFSLSADYWSIKRKNTIQTPALSYLFANYDLFKDQFHYTNGQLTLVEDTYTNTGGGLTQGIDFTGRAMFPLGRGAVSLSLDGTLLLKKNEQVAAGAPILDQLGVYSLASDLGLRWKHNASINYSNEDWSLTFTQLYRSGYKNQVLPGILSGTFDPCCDVTDVNPYITYNLSFTYKGIKGFRITAGVTNLFNVNPPFAISYDSDSGSGSSWEPRVADPRGRAFNLLVETKF